MNYLITGGGFGNKGAEAMTLTAIYNICAHDDQARIYMFKGIVEPTFELKKPVQYIYCYRWLFLYLLGRSMRGYRWNAFKDIIKTIVPGYAQREGNVIRSYRAIKSIDYLIDISGYGFGSKWSDDNNQDWLDWLNVASKYAKKKYLMPQSFGPLEFEKTELCEYAQMVFKRFNHIYAREESSAEYLSQLGINSEKMADSVLIERDYDPSRIIGRYEDYREVIEINNSKNIAIIPNMRLIDRGGLNEDSIIDFYQVVIEKYVGKYDIYLIAHSDEDLELCRRIKERNTMDNRVICVDHVLYSFNYETFIGKMDFIIASRYHSIVHAYKEYIPAVIIGWADKYQSLAKSVEQESYIIRLERIGLRDSLSIVDEMEQNYAVESSVIRQNVLNLQEKSCYGFLEDDRKEW